MKRRLFVLEMKKNIRALPVFFSAMALMALVVFLLVLAGSRMLYRGGSPLSAKIAVVSYEEDSSYIGRLASYLGELSSASAGLEFEIMSEEAARRELKDGEVFAIMLIPDGMMEGILWGNNIPATIILPDKPDLASLVFAELTAAGADLLSAAQSGTYTASYLFSEAGANGSLGNAYDQIDMINFGYVLEREECFKRGVILPGTDEPDFGHTAADPVLKYYICSGILLFAFFSTVAFSAALRRDDPGFYNVYVSKGAHLSGCVLLKTAAHFAVLSVTLLLVYAAALIIQAAAGRELIPASGGLVLYVLILAAVISAFDVFWHMAAGRSAGAVLLQLVSSLIMLFAGGAFLPKAFLPKTLSVIGNMLPASGLHRGLLDILNGAGGSGMAAAGVHAGVLVVLSVCAIMLRSRGDKL